MNKRGVVLIICYMVIAVLATLGAAFLSRSVSERSIASKYFDSTQAFWLAEAGINKGLSEMRMRGFSIPANSIPQTNLDNVGSYNVVFGPISGTTQRNIQARGCIPFDCNCDILYPTNCHITRLVEVLVNKYESSLLHFYDNAIYSASNVLIGGNSSVDGDVFSGGGVTGTVESPHIITQNDPILHNNGLPLLDFEELKQTSINQGWYDDVTKKTTYPTSSFYYEQPSDGNPGIPNVVFVNGDFDLVGGKQIVRGFIVVGGDTIYNAEIGGNASIDGCLYTRGNIWLHGGGGNIINVNGGLWAGGTATLNGNESLIYNEAYMDAIKNGLRPNFDVKVISWKEI